jgi:hypothetical protein
MKKQTPNIDLFSFYETMKHNPKVYQSSSCNKCYEYTSFSYVKTTLTAKEKTLIKRLNPLNEHKNRWTLQDYVLAICMILNQDLIPNSVYEIALLTKEIEPKTQDNKVPKDQDKNLSEIQELQNVIKQLRKDNLLLSATKIALTAELEETKEELENNKYYIELYRDNDVYHYLDTLFNIMDYTSLFSNGTSSDDAHIINNFKAKYHVKYEEIKEATKAVKLHYISQKLMISNTRRACQTLNWGVDKPNHISYKNSIIDKSKLKYYAGNRLNDIEKALDTRYIIYLIANNPYIAYLELHKNDNEKALVPCNKD